MLIPLKFALRAALVVLFAAAVYYRFARYDTLKYYLLFGAWVIVLGVYVWRYGKRFK